MDYIGKRVFHRAKFGAGTVVSQDDNAGKIIVKFDNEDAPKTFLFPACFQSFLQLLDKSAADAAASALKEIEAREAAAKEKERQAVRKKILEKKKDELRLLKRVSGIDQLPTGDMDAFFEAQEKALIAEVSFLRKSGGKRQRLTDGELVERRGSRHIYSFEADQEISLPDSTPVSLWESAKAEPYPATVLNCESFTIIISCEHYFGERVSILDFSADPWHLISSLIDRMKDIRNSPSPIVRQLICDGEKQVQYDVPIQTGQATACEKCLSQPITFIWGPPGTGKTETLANIALQYIDRGFRVLMLSYSNVSVDGAVQRIFDRDKNPRPGKIVRYGYPRSKELMKHEYLTSYSLALYNHPSLQEERDRLTQERQRLPRTSRRYVEIGERLAKIRRSISEEEKSAVKSARFVATTVSKATVDSCLYADNSYDIVLFDEASMAYIPQIIFSASLAKRHFVCLGDFSQLPPIVQNDSKSILNNDIFQFCSITDAVHIGCGHDWLCMLDVQYRMHPEIAAFASRNMYSGLLKSAPRLEEARTSIVNSAPARGNVVNLVDLSGMMSVCSKTGDQSRINVLSAFASIGLALQAATTSEVGIITPYHAQSRLLHAMSRDIAEAMPVLNRITCATVHQFQGSEKDVIIYDAVDCYRMPYPGVLLSSTKNDYANRLYNVALTRARGKIFSVVNADYMRQKKLSSSLMFRRMIDRPGTNLIKGDQVFTRTNQKILSIYNDDAESDLAFLEDLENARSSIRIDVPQKTTENRSWFETFSKALAKARERGVKVLIRTDAEDCIPADVCAPVITTPYVMNPVAIIDKKTVWFGKPSSGADFITDGGVIKTKYRPVLRFAGSHCAQALFGFLEMNQTLDRSTKPAEKNDTGSYRSFSAYVCGEVRCRECGGSMLLKPGKYGRFFISCSHYPACKGTEQITPDMVNKYLWLQSRHGTKCPQDHTTLEAKQGKYGVYVACGSLKPHRYKLDEI